jgi:hypothetical protein
MLLVDLGQDGGVPASGERASNSASVMKVRLKNSRSRTAGSASSSTRIPATTRADSSATRPQYAGQLSPVARGAVSQCQTPGGPPRRSGTGPSHRPPPRATRYLTLTSFSRRRTSGGSDGMTRLTVPTIRSQSSQNRRVSLGSITSHLRRLSATEL